VRLPDRLLDVDQRRLGAARIGPDEIADQHEIRAGGGERAGLLARGGETDARRFEQFVPPLQALGNGFGRGPLTPGVGFAEQHIVGT
jgi:hypothetical protein